MLIIYITEISFLFEVLYHSWYWLTQPLKLKIWKFAIPKKLNHPEIKRRERECWNLFVTVTTQLFYFLSLGLAAGYYSWLSSLLPRQLQTCHNSWTFWSLLCMPMYLHLSAFTVLCCWYLFLIFLSMHFSLLLVSLEVCQLKFLPLNQFPKWQSHNFTTLVIIFPATSIVLCRCCFYAGLKMLGLWMAMRN